MSGSWKLFGIAALVLVAGIWLLGGPNSQPRAVSAANCTEDDRGTLVIRIIDLATDDLLSVGSTTVLIDPDPRDFDLDLLVPDSDATDAGSLLDQDQDPGVIQFDGACATTGSETYEASIYDLAPGLDECEVETSVDSAQLGAGGEAGMELVVDCTAVWAEQGLTPTANATNTAVPTPGQESVEITTSASTVPCGQSALLAVTVRSTAGNPLPGAGVNVATTLGSISPASGHFVGNNGLASMTFVAPAASSGTALITASSGGASDTAQIAVPCPGGQSGGTGGTGGTVVQTTGGASLITPPNTGSAGLLP